MTDGLNTTTMKARLRLWLTMADKTGEGTAVSRRIALAARSALGKLQVRNPYPIFLVCPFGNHAHCASSEYTRERRRYDL